MLSKRNNAHTLSSVVDDAVGINDTLWGSFTGLFDHAYVPVALNPNIEFHEENGKLEYSVDMPGISRDQAKIMLDGDYIKIQAEREGRNNKSHFSTTFKVAERAKLDTLAASMKDGVLTLSFEAKTEEELKPLPRQIEIRSIENKQLVDTPGSPKE